MTSASTHAVGESKIKFLDLLRGIAPLLVLYDHLAVSWPTGNRRSSRIAEVVSDNVSGPLAVIQDFGWLGVAIFFLISGFIIPFVASRESPGAFALKRALRIFPPLWASIALIVVLGWIRSPLGIRSRLVPWSASEVANALFLTNYVRPGGVAVNGVAWTLAIEVLFYSLCLIGWPLVTRRPTTFVLAVLLLVVGCAARWGPRPGGTAFLVTVNLSYIPVLLLGTCVYLRWSKRVGVPTFAVLSALCWLGFVYALRHTQPQFLTSGNSYGVSVAYAYAIFVIALLLDDHIRLPRSVQMMSNVSYSLYLTHGAVGFITLDLLTTKFGVRFLLSLPVAIAVAGGTAYVMWRFVEAPSQRLARQILRRGRASAERSSP